MFPKKKQFNTTPVAKKSVRSDNEFFADRSKEQAATPEGQARSESLNKKLAKNAWESNNSRVRSKLDADASAKSDADYKQTENNKKRQGGSSWVTAEGGSAINTDRM